MERLTARDPAGNAYLPYCEECGGDMCRYRCEHFDKVCEKLMRYEDSGLDPEEISDFMQRWERTVEIAGLCKKGGIDHLLELKKAEQEGKLIVLPWKVGDIIYEVDPEHGVVKHTFAEEPAWMMHSYAEDDAGNVWYDGWGSSDETPFYKSRESAEAALSGKDIAALDTPDEPAEQEWKSRVMRTFLGGRGT